MARLARRKVRLEQGTLVLIGAPRFFDAAEGLARERSTERRPEPSPVELDGRRAWFKGGHLRGSSRLRHAARRVLLASPPPRHREYENLTWLREHGFLAPDPLVAGVTFRAGLPGFQFLVTANVPDAVTLRVFLEQTQGTGERAAVLEELACETARMHALSFVHHDLFPRNLLVGPGHDLDGTPKRVTYIDAWAGGPRPGLRGPAYDLGCLMLRGSELMDEDEQRAFFAAYLAGRAAHGRPLDSARFLDRVRRERDAWVRRLARRPAEQRGLGAPVAGWSPPPVR
jgi:tRNA A-37 threonylcarbamoyl transferase component Bud32